MRSYLVAFAVASLSAIVAATPAAAEGFRAEIHGGWDHASVDTLDDDGVVYGIGLGYDLAVGQNAFIGVDLNLDDSTQKECETNVVVASDKLCVNAGRDLSAGIRAGVNVSERGKVYALAGYTNARFRASYTDATGTESDATNLDGFRLGAGYQHMLGGNTYGKVEYRYSNYENDVDRHQLLVGVGLTF
jgi:outer membrane immunogenic protein